MLCACVTLKVYIYLQLKIKIRKLRNAFPLTHNIHYKGVFSTFNLSQACCFIA